VKFYLILNLLLLPLIAVCFLKRVVIPINPIIITIITDAMTIKNTSSTGYFSNFIYSLQNGPFKLIPLQSHKSLLIHFPPLQLNWHFGS